VLPNSLPTVAILKGKNIENMKRILSIGGGGAGMLSLITAGQIKKGKFEIISLSDEGDIYCRCTTPYIFTGSAYLEDVIEPDSLMTDYDLKIVREKAVSIDVRHKTVTTNKGSVMPYDYLVIATGSSPIIPKLPGVDLPGVFTVRTSKDAKGICDSLEANAKSAVVVGAGVIGLEMAAALRSRGLDIRVVEMQPGLSPRLFDSEYATKVRQHLEDHGIKFYFESELKEVTKNNPDGMEKEVCVERCGEMETFQADMVILAIGVRANIDIVKNTPIKTTMHGIVVNEKMETSVRDVYACGDCCVPLYAPTMEHIPSQLASTAIQQAKIAGFQMAGFPIKYNGSTGAFAFETHEKQYAAVGLNEDQARKNFKWVIVGRAVTTDVYKDLKVAKPLEVKLIFAGPKMRIVGYEAFGHGVIASAELASFMIGMRISILKVLKFNYISHPSMTPWPFMNPIIMATEDAMSNLLTVVRRYIPFI
jgi:NADPH-dependent 2,4-dienoyl-CoA reductase/sulfur reductase-like enzyme